MKIDLHLHTWPKSQCSNIQPTDLVKEAEKIGLDLDNSYAYGNHQSDLPLLEIVGHPHVVEPTLILKKIAHQRSWPILTFR